MIKLRDYQVVKRDEAIKIFQTCGIVYIAGQVRTGKTLIALSMVKELKYNRCLFLTKKIAIGGIEKQYRDIGYTFFLRVINYDQLHNLADDYDIIIYDESHSLGAYPKPVKRTKLAKKMYYEKPVIYLTGTPNPESWSQLYHQFFVSIYSPWSDYVNFYKWAKKYVDVKQKMRGGFPVNDYDAGRKELIQADIKHLTVNLSQKEAGFTQFVEEYILRVPIDPNIYRLMDKLKKDKIYLMKSGDYIMADTPVRKQSTFHQLCSGTIKTDSGDRYTLDKSKIRFIKEKFRGRKIAIFYKFIAEGSLIREYYPNNTEDDLLFNSRSDLVFIKQIVAGREGISLASADCLVMYNIDFSATSYWQARARMQTLDRKKQAALYWIFSERGIESKVYAVVKKKKNFTRYYFEKAIKETIDLQKLLF